MKERFTEEQIIKILKEHAAGAASDFLYKLLSLYNKISCMRA